MIPVKQFTEINHVIYPAFISPGLKDGYFFVNPHIGGEKQNQNETRL